jgi:crossover junction endodeoxyribonuclease RusA
MITLELPWPPSLNSYYRMFRSRILISRSGRAYRKKVIALLQDRFSTALTGRLQVTICAHPPDRRRRDLDNSQKCLLDSLQHAGVFLDDSQIDSLCIHRCNIVPGGQIRLKIIENAAVNIEGMNP